MWGIRPSLDAFAFTRIWAAARVSAPESEGSFGN